MIAITLYDLRYRARQFLIAVIGAALLFSLSLLLSGLADSYPAEARRVVARVGADAWVVPAGSSGPFTSFGIIPADGLQLVSGLAGVTRADPLVIAAESVRVGGTLKSAVVIGHVAGGLGEAPLSSGRQASTRGEAVVDASLHARLGSSLLVQSTPLTVVGITHGESIDAGYPIVLLQIDDARSLVLGGQAVQNAVATRGTPVGLPAGLRAMSNAQVRADALRPLQTPLQTLRASRTAMWVIAALIVAALLYVSALERVRDFAVLKSLGATSVALFVGIAAQAVIVTVVAAIVAAPAANLLKPLLFPQAFGIPTSAYVILPAIAVLIGLVSSLIGLRRATSADPSLAFGR